MLLLLEQDPDKKKQSKVTKITNDNKPKQAIDSHQEADREVEAKKQEKKTKENVDDNKNGILQIIKNTNDPEVGINFYPIKKRI